MTNLQVKSSLANYMNSTLQSNLGIGVGELQSIHSVDEESPLEKKKSHSMASEMRRSFN